MLEITRIMFHGNIFIFFWDTRYTLGTGVSRAILFIGSCYFIFSLNILREVQLNLLDK
jgi:hypothetical protein